MSIGELVEFLRSENAQEICVVNVPPEMHSVTCSGKGLRHISKIAHSLVDEMKGVAPKTRRHVHKRGQTRTIGWLWTWHVTSCAADLQLVLGQLVQVSPSAESSVMSQDWLSFWVAFLICSRNDVFEMHSTRTQAGYLLPAAFERGPI
ncbi:hypothetical protein EMCRGX_G005958 [Ephydatia muelleri]